MIAPDQFNAFLEALVRANPTIPREEIEALMVRGGDTYSVEEDQIVFDDGSRVQAPTP